MFRNLARYLVAGALSLGLVAFGFADDVIKTKDGKTYSGQIVSEEDGFITLEIGSGTLKKKVKIWSDDVESVTRDDDAVTDSPDSSADVPEADLAAPADSSTEESTPQVIDPDTKKLFVVPLEGMVGKEFRCDKIQECVDSVRDLNPDIIILLVDSGGGSLNELYQISDYLTKLRDEYRVVTWIKSAISAAAMTAINTREIYFMRKGHMGAATAWYGPGIAVNGPELEAWLARGARMGKSAGYDPAWIRAMIDREQECSATRVVLPNGEVKVTWYADSTSGEDVINRKGEVLTFQASDALKWRISLGTADTTEELAPLLGVTKWVEISDKGRKIMGDWLALNKRADKEVPKLIRDLNSSDPASRAGLSTQARVLKELINWSNRLGDAAMYFGLDKPALERNLRDVLKRLRDMGG